MRHRVTGTARSDRRSAVLKRHARRRTLQIRGANRSFGLLLAAVAALFAAIGFSRREDGGYIGFGVLTIVLVIVALTIPRVLAPLRRGWLRLGHVLGRFINPVVLGLSYVAVIVPAGLLMRMFGRNALGLRRDPSAATYWITREVAGPDAESLKEQF